LKPFPAPKDQDATWFATLTEEEFLAWFESLPKWSEEFPCPNSGEAGFVPKSLALQRAEFYTARKRQTASE